MTETLKTGTWQRLGTLFDHYVDVSPGARRLHELDEDRTVLAWLERVLEAADRDDSVLLDQTVQRVTGTLLQITEAQRPQEALTGRCFGPWRAHEEIGRGGMSVVMRGQRSDGQ